MRDQLVPLAIFQLAALVGAVGQLFYKRGAKGSKQPGRRGAALGNILVGMFLYVSVTLLFVLAYRLGGAVSILYPSYASTFVWGLVLACFFSGERLTTYKLLGTGGVIGGICLVTC
jgi:drug/metabolite transporter (DMT)-like permease